MNNRKDKKDCWDKAKIIGTFLIPFAIVISGFWIDGTIKEKEIKLKYIEIAVSILRDDPNNDTRRLRLWAIEVVQKFSVVPFSEDVVKELEQSALPYKNVLRDRKGNILVDREGKPISTRQ